VVLMSVNDDDIARRVEAIRQAEAEAWRRLQERLDAHADRIRQMAELDPVFRLLFPTRGPSRSRYVLMPTA
jgi:hypothetical protein